MVLRSSSKRAKLELGMKDLTGTQTRRFLQYDVSIAYVHAIRFNGRLAKPSSHCFVAAGIDRVAALTGPTDPLELRNWVTTVRNILAAARRYERTSRIVLSGFTRATEESPTKTATQDEPGVSLNRALMTK